MADIHISKIKVRRGTNAEINSTRFDQGELIHATDSKRLFVGNGVLSGGNPVSSKVHPPLINYSSLSTTLAEVGDLVSVNSIWYQLTASPYSSPTNWGDMGTKFSTEFVRNNVSTINMAVSGLSASKINPNTITNGIKIADNKLQLDYRTNFFEISSNQLSIKTGGITTREILSSSFGSEFVHGNTINMAVSGLSASKINANTVTNGIKITDDKLQLDYRTNFFEISSNQLSIKTGGITTREVISSFFSSEFVHSNNVSTVNMAVGGLSASKINPDTITNGIKIADTKLQLDYRTNFFEISSNQLSIKTGGITTREILSSSFGSEFVHSNNVSTINMAVSGLSASKINANTVTNGVNIIDGKIQLNYRTNFFEISSNQLSIKTGGITTREILSSSFGDGLSGGNGKSISLTVSPTDFSFSSGILSANYTRISAYGLNTQFHPPVSAYDALSALNAKIGDTTSFGNVIYQLNSFPLLSSSNWIPITKNGISIYDTLTGSSTRNSTNSLSSIFNGSPSQNTDGVVPGITLTSFTALSSNGLSSVTITLSSAGFIAFAGDYTSETGKSVNRFAIPIFTY
jgi:hypothetical protein